MLSIKQHLKDNKGDSYIEMMICSVILLLMAVIFFSVSTSVVDKLKIDQKMDDIASMVSATGTTKSEALTELENDLIDAYGGEISYDATYIGSSTYGRVQLNDVVIITYHVDKYTSLLLSEFEISTPINISRSAISEVYWKD